MTTMQAGAAVVVASLLGLAVFLYTSSKAKYEEILTDEHYLEIAKLISEEKASAIELGNKEISPSGSAQNREIADPRVRISGKGVVAMYTVELVENQYLHRISFSHHGHALAFAAGGRFAFFSLTTLGVDPASVIVAHSGVTHVAFVLDRGKQNAFANSGPKIPAVGELTALKERATAWVHSTVESKKLLASEDDLVARLEETLTRQSARPASRTGDGQR